MFIHPVALAPILAIGGAVGAPIMIISSTLLDTVAARGALTESYTTLIAAMLLGIAAGSYAAGLLSDRLGGPSVFVAAALTLAAVAAWTLARGHTLAPPGVRGG